MTDDMAIIRPTKWDYPINSTIMEVALSRHFDSRTNLIVPNVWWGLGLGHECDILVVSKKGYATEVEIKISKSDFKREAKKHHCHMSHKIKSLYFAFPDFLDIDENNINKNAGIIKVYPNGRCKVIRVAIMNHKARPLSDGEIDHLYRLGCMRIWTLKEKLIQADIKKRGRNITNGYDRHH